MNNENTYPEKEINFNFESEDEDSYFEEDIFFGTEKVELNPPEEKTPVKPQCTRPLEVTKKPKPNQTTITTNTTAQTTEHKTGPTSSKNVWAENSFAIRNSGSKAPASSVTLSSSPTQPKLSVTLTTTTSSTTTAAAPAPTSSASISLTTTTTHSVTPVPPPASSFPALSSQPSRIQSSPIRVLQRQTERTPQKDMRQQQQQQQQQSRNDERNSIRERRQKSFDSRVESEQKASQSPIRLSGSGSNTDSRISGGNNNNNNNNNNNSSGGYWRTTRQGHYHDEHSSLKEREKKEIEEKIKQRREEELKEKERRESIAKEKIRRLDERASNAEQNEPQRPAAVKLITKDQSSRVKSFTIESTHTHPNSLRKEEPKEEVKIAREEVSTTREDVKIVKEESKTVSSPTGSLTSTDGDSSAPGQPAKRLNIVKKTPSQHASQSPSPAMHPQTPPPTAAVAAVPVQTQHQYKSNRIGIEVNRGRDNDDREMPRKPKGFNTSGPVSGDYNNRKKDGYIKKNKPYKKQN